MADVLSQYCTQFLSLYAEVLPLGELKEKVAPLVSTQTVSLPVQVMKDVEATVKSLFKFSRTPEQIERVRKHSSEHEILDHKTDQLSILMAYDFHYDPATQQLSLIEINTNASGFLFADLMYRAVGSSWHCNKRDPRLSLLEAIETEWKAFGGSSQRPRTIAIIDEQPDQQKMFLEFLMYDSYFKQNGMISQIFDYTKLPVSGEHDFVYNRYNDFTFKGAASAHLRKAYLKKKICFSPQPREYLLLAHKQRLVEFGEAKVSPNLIPIIDMAHADSDELWEKRKHLFFKPKALFGAKAVYRGSSISRKTFDQLEKSDYIAQEFRPPGTVGNFKFDLRFYAYGDEIHLGIARTYQGQVTNFATPGGGFAPLAFR